MALFTDIEPDYTHKRRRGWIGWAILGVAMLGIVAVALVPAPYVIEVPGPVYDTLGTVQVSGAEVELIEIDGEETFPTAGSLDMLTVRIEGSRENLPTWLEIGQAYLDPSKAVLPVDDVFPLGYSVDDSNVQGQIDMQNSQQEAIAAALSELGYEFESRLKVATTQPGAPADGVLEAGDIIASLNGQEYADVTGLRAGIAENGTESPATLVIERGGVEQTVAITPVLSEGDQPAPIIGIIVGGEYDFPVDVKIQLENVGGPSAGMMFALGIIDKLTEGELNGGEIVAGTGTIGGDGTVGPIGGIRQKMYGAQGAGATWFLAPVANCNEVTGHIPGGITVFSVETLDDAIAALDVIADGGDTSTLSTCPG